MKKNQILILTALSLFFVSLVSAETDLSFTVPGPPQSKPLGSQPLRIGGREILASAFESQEEKSHIVDYYQDFFKEQDFKQLSDKPIFKTTTRQMRFKKEDLVVDVYLSAQEEKTEVVVAKYLQPEGAPDLENSPLSVKDSFFSLPTQDAPGEDLRFIPRPPESLRLSSIKLDQGKNIFLTYMTPLSVEQAKDFYKLNMPYQTWLIQRDMPTGELVEDYKKATGKKSLGMYSAFSDAENFDSVVHDGYLLDFKSGFGSASITIFPNFIDKKLGSVVQIVYLEGKNE